MIKINQRLKTSETKKIVATQNQQYTGSDKKLLPVFKLKIFTG